MWEELAEVAALRLHLRHVQLEAPHRFYLVIQLVRCSAGIQVLHEATSDVSPVSTSPRFLNCTYHFPLPLGEPNPSGQRGTPILEGLECQFKLFIVPDSGRHGGEAQLYGYSRISLTQELVSHLSTGQRSDVSVDVLFPHHHGGPTFTTSHPSSPPASHPPSGPPLSATAPLASLGNLLSLATSSVSSTDLLAGGALAQSLPQGNSTGAAAGMLGQLAVRLMVVGRGGSGVESASVGHHPAIAMRTNTPSAPQEKPSPAPRTSTWLPAPAVSKDAGSALVPPPSHGARDACRCQLSILVTCARNLPCVRKHKDLPKDTPPSAFVAVKTTRMAAAGLPAKVVTRAVLRSRDPFWHELLLLDLDEADAQESVFLAVVNHETRKILGKCAVFVGGLEEGRPYNLALPLQLPGQVQQGRAGDPALFCTVALHAPASSGVCKHAATARTAAMARARKSNDFRPQALPGVEGMPTSNPSVAIYNSSGGADGINHHPGSGDAVTCGRTRFQLTCLDWCLHPAALARILSSLPTATPTAVPGSDGNKPADGDSPAEGVMGPSRAGPPTRRGSPTVPESSTWATSRLTPRGEAEGAQSSADASNAREGQEDGSQDRTHDLPVSAPVDEASRHPPTQIPMQMPAVPTGLGTGSEDAGRPGSSREPDAASEDGGSDTFDTATPAAPEAVDKGCAPGVIMAAVWLLHPNDAALGAKERPNKENATAQGIGAGNAMGGEETGWGPPADLGVLSGEDKSGSRQVLSGMPAVPAQVAVRASQLGSGDSPNRTPRTTAMAPAQVAALVESMSTSPGLFQDEVPLRRRDDSSRMEGGQRSARGESPLDGAATPGGVALLHAILTRQAAQGLFGGSPFPLVFPVFAPSPNGMMPIWIEGLEDMTSPATGIALAHAPAIAPPAIWVDDAELADDDALLVIHLYSWAPSQGGCVPLRSDPLQAAEQRALGKEGDSSDRAGSSRGGEPTAVISSDQGGTASKGDVKEGEGSAASSSAVESAGSQVDEPMPPSREGSALVPSTPSNPGPQGTPGEGPAVSADPIKLGLQGGLPLVSLVGSARVPLRDIRGSHSGPWQVKVPLATTLTVTSAMPLAGNLAYSSLRPPGGGSSIHDLASSLEPVVTEKGVLLVEVRAAPWAATGPGGQQPLSGDGKLGQGMGVDGVAALVPVPALASTPLESVPGYTETEVVPAGKGSMAQTATPHPSDTSLPSLAPNGTTGHSGAPSVPVPLVASWLRLLLSDLWEKQKAAEALVGVAGTKGDAMAAEAAGRMAALKERNQLLSEDVAHLRRLLEETQEALRTAQAGVPMPDGGGKDLARMSPEELLAHAHALARRCDAEQQRNRQLEAHLHKLHRGNMAAAALEHKYRELQEAHQAMSVAMLGMQDDLARMHTVRETVHSQEKVISRLEQLLATSAGETRRLLAAEQELHYLRDAHARMMQLEPVRDHQQVDALQEQLREAHTDNLRLQQEKMAAMLRAETAEGRAVSAQNELLDSTKRFAQEMSKLKVRSST
eukprot:jgi/Mesvir1/15177/Mv06421-RA.2